MSSDVVVGALYAHNKTNKVVRVLDIVGRKVYVGSKPDEYIEIPLGRFKYTFERVYEVKCYASEVVK